MPPLTYDTATATERLGAPSERWLIEQIRAGRFRARKIGRHWRLTENDIAEALEACSNGVQQAPKKISPLAKGLTPTSRKRLGR